GQRKYAATLTSKIIAQRNILEVIKGVHITSEITIENGLKSSAIIKSRMTGVIKGAQIISNKYDQQKGSAVAVAKLRMGADILSALLSDPKLLSFNEKIMRFWNDFSIITKANATTYYEKDKKTIQKLLNDLRENTQAKVFLENILKDMDGDFSGILIDISNLVDFQKALIVKLVDTNGKEIYPSNKVSKAMLTKRNTSVGYMFGLEDARKNLRVFDKPLEIAVNKVYKNKKSNLVLTDKQIEKLNRLDKDVFKNAKIILVLGD
ncbi:MAG: hypothetical protein KAJ49_09315, partial [Arcobacteraceae bacterium]|nr:hypothetical protein [Arcobacteraceae bacterium]